MVEENKVETATNESTQVAPSIGLADLQNAVKVIDYAAEQGAFKGWAVIEQVLAVRNKINAFVAFSTPKEEAVVAAPVEAEVVAPAKKVTKTVKKVK